MTRFGLIATLLTFSVLGCRAHHEPGTALSQKPGSDRGPRGDNEPVQVFRVFGSAQPMIAVYNRAGTLQAVHKVLIADRGTDFWPVAREDARIAREATYVAVSRTPVLLTAAKSRPTSFRVDLYRGAPEHKSVIGHDLLLTFLDTNYLASGPTRGTHVMVGDQSEVHAVPHQASNDLVSFAVTDGVNAAPGRWADAVLAPTESRPATTAMGCTANYSGEIVTAGTHDNAEFWGVCEKKAPALPSAGG